MEKAEPFTPDKTMGAPHHRVMLVGVSIAVVALVLSTLALWLVFGGAVMQHMGSTMWALCF